MCPPSLLWRGYAPSFRALPLMAPVASGYNRSYTHVVKTAISIPDEVFTEAEAEARRLGLSRSGLYSRAVAEFVEKNRGLGVREALDSVYATEDSRVDVVLARMQAASLPDEGW
jgi:hypothetical protein